MNSTCYKQQTLSTICSPTHFGIERVDEWIFLIGRLLAAFVGRLLLLLLRLALDGIVGTRDILLLFHSAASGGLAICTHLVGSRSPDSSLTRCFFLSSIMN